MSQKYGHFVRVTNCRLSTLSPTQKHLVVADGFENPTDPGSWVVARV